MSVVIVGGHDRMVCQYKKICKEHNCKAKVFTQMPGMQIYTGNFLNGGARGKEDCCYEKHGGVCFETQFFPDAVNNKAFKSSVVKAGVPFKYITVYKFSTK